MLTSADELKQWVKLQEHIVIAAGAYLAPIRDYIERCKREPGYADDMNAVYQLHTLVRGWDNGEFHRPLGKLGLMAYFKPFIRAPNDMLELVTRQSIPSTRMGGDEFALTLARYADSLAEVIVAFAKVPPPLFSITIVAGTPFDAYLLLTRVITAATEYVFIADNFLDASIFDRYLYRAAPTVQVSLRTNPLHWNKKGGKEQFEQAEAVFSQQHPSYDRKDRTDFHARHLITETGAWRIDGSIKDIGFGKDCEIHTVGHDERERVLSKLFA